MTSLLPWLIDAALKSTALLLVVFGLTLLLRRASAAVRHLVWGLGVAGALALPLVSAVLPWRLAVLPSRPVAVTSPAPDLDLTIADAAIPAPAPSTGSTERLSPPPADETVSSWRFPGTAPTLVALWIAGAVLALAHLGLGALSAWRLARRAAPLGQVSPWGALLHQLKAQLGVRAPVRLLLSDRTPLPATWGLTRPVIILPRDAQTWSDDRRRAVLLHELAHIARNDLFIHLAAQVACSLYWFNPLVWVAARRLRAESERACDDLVLGNGIRASDYAVQLLQIVRSVGRVRAPAIALPLAQRSEFEGRLLAILEPGLERRGLTRGTATLIGAVVAAFALPLAALGPARAAAAPIEITEQSLVQAPQDASSPRRPQATPTPTPRAAPRPMPKPQVAQVVQPEPSPAPSARLAPELWQLHQPKAQSPQRSQAVSPLIATLQDADPGVRAAAVRALGEIQDPAAIAALAQALQNDANPAVREMAAWALGQIEDAAAVTALGNALRTDREASVRKQAAWALGQIEDARAVDALSAALRDQNLEVRRMVVWALGQIEDAKAVAPLAQVLRTDADAELRERAAWALGQIEDATGLDALGAALRDQSLEVRRMVVWAMGQIEDARSAPLLIPALRDSDVEVRRQVAWALGQIQNPSAVDALVAALRDTDPKVRAMAAWALGEIQNARAADGLAAALKDENVDVRKNAAWALGELDNLSAAPPTLIEALSDGDRNVRLAAAHAVSEIQDPAAVAALGRLTQDTDPQVRRAAVHGLAEIASEASIEILVNLLKHEDPEVRRTAARALGQRR